METQEKVRKPTGRELDAEQLRKLVADGALRSPSELVRTIAWVPNEVAVGLMAGRPELIGTPTRQMSVQEQAGLVDLVRGLLETNMALQMHAQRVGAMAHELVNSVKGLVTTGQRIEDFANFRAEMDEVEEN